MDTGKNLIVTIRTYRGEINYDQNGKVKSENQPVKLTYGSGAWDNFMKHARLNHTSMEVEKTVEETLINKDTGRTNAQGFKITRPEYSYEYVDVSDKIKIEVKSFMSSPKKALTPEQIKIEAQQKQIDALIAAQPGNTEEVKSDRTPDVNEELEAARKELHQLTGNKPSHLFKLSTLNKKIAEYKAENE